MLNEQIIQTLKENRVEAERVKMLTTDLLTLTYDQNWFRMWVPSSLGGLDMDLLTGCKLLEDLAYWDGGYAWTITLCAGATMFAGFIEPSVARMIFNDRKVCLGGSGQVAGRAVRIGDEYVLTGQWQYATGAPHLSHFTLNSHIYEDGVLVVDANGVPVVKSFFVDRDQVLLHYDWDTFGLCCTASHSFSMESVKVHKYQSFDIDPARKKIDQALFAYPFISFAEVTLLVNYMGMFKRFLDLLQKHLFDKSKSNHVSQELIKSNFQKLDAIEQSFGRQRGRIFELIKLSYEHVNEQSFLQEISVLSRDIVRNVLHNTTQLFPVLGIVGAQRDSEVNCVFRNIFTASQHRLLSTQLPS